MVWRGYGKRVNVHEQNQREREKLRDRIEELEQSLHCLIKAVKALDPTLQESACRAEKVLGELD